MQSFSPDEAAAAMSIQQLAAVYAESVSRHQVREAVRVYAPDGVLSTPTTADAEGPGAIADMIEKTISSLDFVFQTVSLGRIEVQGDRARARFPIYELGRRRADGRTIHFLGVYDDEAVLTADGWRFARRNLRPRTLGKADTFAGALHPIPAPFADGAR